MSKTFLRNGQIILLLTKTTLQVCDTSLKISCGRSELVALEFEKNFHKILSLVVMKVLKTGKLALLSAGVTLHMSDFGDALSRACNSYVAFGF